MPKLKPGQFIGTELPPGVGVAEIGDIAALWNDPVKGQGFREALDRANNESLHRTGRPLKAVVMMQRALRERAETWIKIQRKLDARAAHNKRVLDRKIFKDNQRSNILKGAV